MMESEMLSRMKAPGDKRPTAYRQGVMQVLITSNCDKSCFGCTQGSQLRRKLQFMSVDQFKQAIESLRGFTGVIGVFGGNPALHPQFADICEAYRGSWVPKEQRGIWCNNPITVENARAMRETFTLGVSNLNVHLDQKAHALFKEGWPESNPVGLHTDSRHAPVFGSMRDLKEFWKTCPECNGTTQKPLTARGSDPCQTCDTCFDESKGYATGTVYDEAKANALIAECDVNQRWSPMISVFRGRVVGWFCEVAGAMSILHQDDPNWPDTGITIADHVGYCYGPQFNSYSKHLSEEQQKAVLKDHVKVEHWWQLPMTTFRDQVRQHCHSCLVPLRGRGELAMAGDGGRETTTKTHEDVFRTKKPLRIVQFVNSAEQLGHVDKVTSYLQNAKS